MSGRLDHAKSPTDRILIISTALKFAKKGCQNANLIEQMSGEEITGRRGVALPAQS
jgi:hypothetical protein